MGFALEIDGVRVKLKKFTGDGRWRVSKRLGRGLDALIKDGATKREEAETGKTEGAACNFAGGCESVATAIDL